MKYLCAYICLRHVIGIGDGVPYKSGECGLNRCQRLSCVCCSCVACEICIFVWRSLVTLAIRAWRVTRKLGDFGNESLENHWKR